MTKVPMETVPIPSVAEVELKVPFPEPFDHIANRRQSAKEQIKRLDRVVKDADKQLVEVLDLSGYKNVVWNDWVICRRAEAEYPQLDTDWARQKLLALGVPPTEIAEHSTMVMRSGGITFRPAAVDRASGNADDSAN